MSISSISDLHIDNAAGTIGFQWSTGERHQITISKLRGMCPCAVCQGHGNPPAFISNRVSSISQADFIGRYALSFRFGDGHSTGIYTWDFLRQITALDT